MLLEKVQGDDARDIFAASTNCELTLLSKIKASRSILVHPQVIYGGLKEAIHAHVNRVYVLDDQFCWVRDRGL